MGKIGILAFGSIISEPKEEIEAATERKITSVTTDFKIEFARSSTSRANAPTLAVVENGGSSVQGTLFILKYSVTLSEAKDMLYRREKNQVGVRSIKYNHKTDWMEIKRSYASADCEQIIYASMTANISEPTAKKLAELAIESTKKNLIDGEGKRRDGIQYLYDVKKMGITTSLMKEYEDEILSQLEVDSLEEALEETRKYHF